MTSTNNVGGRQELVAPTSRREYWLDLARGAVVVLVILYHACEIVNADTGYQISWLDTVNRALGPIRMPLMMFLAGFLLAPAIRKGVRRFISNRLRCIAWPLFLWAVVYVAAFNLVSGSTATKHSWWELLNVFTVPPGQLWFLQYLIGFYLLTLVLGRLPAGVVIASAFASGSAVWALTDLYGLPRFLMLFGMFALGDLTFRRGRWLIEDRRVAVAGGLAALVLIPVALLTSMSTMYNPLLLPATIGGVFAVLHLVQRVQYATWTRPIRFVGRDSITFYLMHWLCSASVSQVLGVLLDGRAHGLVIGLAFVAGIVVPAFTVWLVRRRPVLRLLFALPARTRAQPSTV